MVIRPTALLALFSALLIGGLLRLAQPFGAQAQIAPFLYPPFLGASALQDASAYFDHTAPLYNGQAVGVTNTMTLYNGTAYACTVPTVAPGPTPTPVPRGGCGNGASYTGSGGFDVSYDGHNGVDFRIRWQPVVAAAYVVGVDAAGWRQPTNRAGSYGLYVVLRHPNGYSTLYGHLSTVAVPVCSSCEYPQGQFLGMSGNTGNSTGAHLHFSVFNANRQFPTQDSNREVIDPYGWTPASSPVWANNQRESLWVVRPHLGSGPFVYPNGSILPIPGIPPINRVVEDTDPNVAGVWTVEANSQASGGSWRFAAAVATSGNPSEVRWAFSLPAGSEPGLYRVYVRIPSRQNWTAADYADGAVYRINHSSRIGQAGVCETSSVIVSQREVIAATTNLSNIVYLGMYPFGVSGCTNESVRVSNVVVGQIATSARVVADTVTFGWVGVPRLRIPSLLRSSGPPLPDPPQGYPGPASAPLRGAPVATPTYSAYPGP